MAEFAAPAGRSGPLREAGLLGFIVVLSLLVQVLNPRFLSLENLADMAKNTAILSILAVGMMLVIVTRGIDLSIGASLALAGMVAASAVAAFPATRPLVAIALGIGVGLLCGSCVGLLVARGKVLPIIATLGLMNVFRGVTFLVSDGKWINANQMPASFKAIALSSSLGINTLIWIAIAINASAAWLLTYSRAGRRIYAVGSNPESAQISGIDVERTLYWVYTITGGLSGLAGVLWVAKFASAQGDTAMGFELSVIAACVLGGVSIAGGAGRISGVILGALLLGILGNAMPLVNVSPFWQTFIQGAIILSAVLVNALVKRGVMRRSMQRRRI